MFDQLIRYLEVLAQQIPLEVFVIIGSVLEEIIAPIPSPLVMTLAGSLAHSQGQAWYALFWLALLGATGKTLGAYVLYYVADKLEDVVVTRFGKYLGVSHSHIETIGAKLDGSWKDNVFLFIARALPIIPSAPVSLACGIIKLNKKTYITSTFAGTYVKDLLYLYLGYSSIGNYKEIIGGIEGVEDVGKMIFFVVAVIVVAWAYLQRSKHLEK